MKNDHKHSIDASSSANHVEQHLQKLETTETAITREQLYYSQEQPFCADELTTLFNASHLDELLARSDAFLDALHRTIKDFDDHDSKE